MSAQTYDLADYEPNHDDAMGSDTCRACAVGVPHSVCTGRWSR